MKLCRLVFLAGSMALGLLANAQSYPDKATPIKMIVPVSAGSSIDLLARAIARGMSDVAGLNVAVDNKPGADGIIGAQAAKQATPDGYTMMVTTVSTQAVNPHLYRKLPYDPVGDFIPLVGVGRTPMMMNVGPSVPFKSAREFLAAAKANPGKYTVGNASSTTKVAAEMLKHAAGVDILAVSFKSFSEAFTDVAAGRVDFVIVDAATARAFYPQGVRPLAVSTATRTSDYPNVPTLQEEGVAGYDAAGWFAAYFPAKTPPAMVATMREILRKAVKTTYVTDVYSTSGMGPLDLTGDDLDKFQRAESEKWGHAVRAANIEPK